MAHLLPNVKQKFFDADGEPLNGGKLYSFEAGTSTPLATYTDQEEGTENDNPTILDANGEASIWLGAGAYKFRLDDADDQTLWTVDDVSVISPGYITASMLADGAVSTAKMADGALANSTQGRAKMADGFLSADTAGRAKMADGYVNTAKLASGALSADATGRGKMADGFLSADSTGRAKMADGYVTPAKMAASSIQISNSSGGGDVTGTVSYEMIGEQSVSLTTTGRPVFIGVVSDGSEIESAITGESSTNSIDLRVRILQGSTPIANYWLLGTMDAENIQTLSVPIGALWHVYQPAAGTYTYKLEARLESGTSASISRCKLIAYEIRS
jgi:hypothetical protein